jgi:cytochrome c553
MDWAEIKQAIGTLNAAAVTVAKGGPGRSDRDWTKLAKWQEWSTKLTTTVQTAKRASDRKDRRALATAGESLVTVCQGCHIAVAIAAP